MGPAHIVDSAIGHGCHADPSDRKPSMMFYKCFGRQGVFIKAFVSGGLDKPVFERNIPQLKCCIRFF
jgi:hypothetical protein